MQYAKEKGHKAVVTCETSTKLAAVTLSAMSKGQGWNIGELVSAVNVPVHGSGECMNNLPEERNCYSASLSSVDRRILMVRLLLKTYGYTVRYTTSAAKKLDSTAHKLKSGRRQPKQLPTNLA